MLHYLKFSRKGLIVAVGLAVLAALYSVYWFVVATNLKDGFTTWSHEMLDENFQINYHRIETSGFPTTFRFVLEGPSLTAKTYSHSESEIDWRWQGSQVIIEIMPWNINRSRIDISGNHDITISTKKKHYRYTGTVASLILKMDLFDDGLPGLASLVATGLDFTQDKTNQQITTRNLRLMTERIFPTLVSSKTPTFDLKLNIEDVSLPKNPALPLGNFVKHLGANAQVFGKLQKPFDVGTLSKWRDEGGIIELELVETHYGPLNFVANGTLALDENLQILAALTAKVQGVDLAIDQLNQAGTIKPWDVALAKMIIGVFSEHPTDNGPTTINFPLNIQDGKLIIQNLKLLSLPKIHWPDTPRRSGGL